MFVAIQWYYNDRDGKAMFPELSGTFGPFPDADSAREWIDKAETWGGWGRYEYQVSELYTPEIQGVA